MRRKKVTISLDMKYAVVEISGKQYKVTPDQVFLVDFLGSDAKNFECDKVLLLADDKKTSVGTPFLKEKLSFEVLENVKLRKIQSRTYHAKANYRRIKGIRPQATKLKLVA